MLKRLFISLVVAAAGVTAAPVIFFPDEAQAASCLDQAAIPGEIRYDAGGGVCRRAVVNPDGSLSVGGGTPTNPNANPATIYSGQQTCTTGAVALPSQALVNGIVITAGTENVGTIEIGPSSVSLVTGYDLQPGQSISFGVSDLSAIYMLCLNSTDAVTFTGN